MPNPNQPTTDLAAQIAGLSREEKLKLLGIAMAAAQDERRAAAAVPVGTAAADGSSLIRIAAARGNGMLTFRLSADDMNL